MPITVSIPRLALYPTETYDLEPMNEYFENY